MGSLHRRFTVVSPSFQLPFTAVRQHHQIDTTAAETPAKTNYLYMTYHGSEHDMTFDEKEAAKAAFGFSSVPFCVVFGADGAVHYKGDPKDIDYATVFDAKPASSAEPAPPTPSKALASALEKTAVTASEPPAVPLGESNRTPAAPVALGFGNDDEDF